MRTTIITPKSFHRGKDNAKLKQLEEKTGRKLYTFSLASGWSCPMAKDCHSKAVVQQDGRRKIVDGKQTQFRCFSATQEARLSVVWNDRWHNFNALRGLSEQQTTKQLHEAFPTDAGIVRVHIGGDFFSPIYFRSWLHVASLHPQTWVYAYTKSLPYWLDNLSYISKIPNLVLTASYGGRCDHLIAEHGLRYSKVVFSKSEARKLRLPIDHDDSHAADPKRRNKSFALLLHGVQPKGSEASEALKALKGEGSYSRS